jgi:hypothetical protein
MLNVLDAAADEASRTNLWNPGFGSILNAQVSPQVSLKTGAVLLQHYAQT